MESSSSPSTAGWAPRSGSSSARLCQKPGSGGDLSVRGVDRFGPGSHQRSRPDAPTRQAILSIPCPWRRPQAILAGAGPGCNDRHVPSSLILTMVGVVLGAGPGSPRRCQPGGGPSVRSCCNSCRSATTTCCIRTKSCGARPQTGHGSPSAGLVLMEGRLQHAGQPRCNPRTACSRRSRRFMMADFMAGSTPQPVAPGWPGAPPVAPVSESSPGCPGSPLPRPAGFSRYCSE